MVKKNAVVLGGGGAKGSYEAGVLKALDKLKFRYQIVTGTSVGSLNGAMAVQKNIQAAKKFWLSIRTEDILDRKAAEGDEMAFFQELLAGRGFTYSGLEKLLYQAVDEKVFRRSPIDFGLVTVSFPSLKPLKLFKEDIEEGQLIHYLLASAACFPMMKPHTIDGKQYIDGGYYDNIPIQMAVDRGATNIVAVDLRAIGIVRKQKFEGVKITYVKSYWPLGDILRFDPEQAERNIRLGYLDTLKAFGALEGTAFTFSPRVKKQVIKRFYKKSRELYEEIFRQAPAMARISLFAMKKLYKKRTGLKAFLREEDLLLFVMENVMEIFEMDPLVLYSYPKALGEIKKAFLNTSLSQIEELNAFIKEFGTTERLKVLLKEMDRKKIIKFIAKLILNNRNKEKQPGILNLMMTFAPVELLCGIFLAIVFEKEGITDFQ